MHKFLYDLRIKADIIHTSIANIALFAPKSSKYIIKHAIGALVAPEKTPTSPNAAENANGEIKYM